MFNHVHQFGFDSPWRDRVRRMQRSEPIYKPAMLLAVVDLIEDETASSNFVPLGLALNKFDELLASAGLLNGRPKGRGEMPAFYLSKSSNTREPFWDLVKAGKPVGKFNGPSGIRSRADGFRLLPELAFDFAAVEKRQEACKTIRRFIYSLLEDDARPDCQALLETHDEDKREIDDLVRRLLEAEESTDFVLDDPAARRIQIERSQIVRDRAFRLAVLPVYGHSCALCGTRLRWNNLYEAEAAHIKPRSLSGVDDVRNGLSLCQTHHWAFDLGLWSATDDLVVMVRRKVADTEDDLEALQPFHGEPLKMPASPTAKPSPIALEWHRDIRFGKAA